jgi:hypothetical protein
MTHIKDITNKPKIGLLPYFALSQCAVVREYGDSKYFIDSWQDVDVYHLVDAALRHLLKYCSGAKFDDESGLHHLAHAATSTLLALENIKHEIQED